MGRYSKGKLSATVDASQALNISTASSTLGTNFDDLRFQTLHRKGVEIILKFNRAEPPLARQISKTLNVSLTSGECRVYSGPCN